MLKVEQKEFNVITIIQIHILNSMQWQMLIFIWIRLVKYGGCGARGLMIRAGWMTNVFPRVYRDDESMVILDEEGASVISMLLLRRYDMRYHGVIVPVAYIYGAATARNRQGNGYMSQLIRDSLREAYSRGDIFATLQPARRRLYGFYDRFGFATTFYIREERYTARHRFAHDDSQYIIETSGHDPAELAAAYKRLTDRREANMLHTENDFKTILIDCELDSGNVVTARSVNSGDITAIALANADNDTIAVRELRPPMPMPRLPHSIP